MSNNCQSFEISWSYNSTRPNQNQFQTRCKIMEFIDFADHYWSVAQLNGVGLQGLFELIVIACIIIFKVDITNWCPSRNTSTSHSSEFARLEFGAFYFAIRI